MIENKNNLIKNRAIRIIGHILYFIFGIGYILAGQLDISELRTFKVFPLVILILLILPSQRDLNAIKLILGVMFGIAGDLVLQYGGHQSLLFSVGAGCFLIGHVCYNFSMFDLWQRKTQILLLRRKVAILFGNATLLSGSFINLSTTISDKMKQQNFLMVILMPIYLIFLTFNCINAYILMIANKRIDRYHLLLFLGTVMFVISDNVLGRGIFTDFKIFNKKINSIVIMTTYYLGQYLIVLNVHTLFYQHQKIENTQRQTLLTETSDANI